MKFGFLHFQTLCDIFLFRYFICKSTKNVDALCLRATELNNKKKKLMFLLGNPQYLINYAIF